MRQLGTVKAEGICIPLDGHNIGIHPILLLTINIFLVIHNPIRIHVVVTGMLPSISVHLVQSALYLLPTFPAVLI